MRRLNRSRRGVTIAEVMVAMTIILVVSAAAVTLVTAFSKASAKLLWRSDAISLGENTFECFKAADTYANYISLLYSVTDFDLTITNYEKEAEEVPINPLDPSQGSTEIVHSERATLSYNTANYSVRIYVTFGEDTALFSEYIFDSKAESILSIENYQKAVIR